MALTTKYYQELARYAKLDLDKTTAEFAGVLKDKSRRPDEFSFKELAEHLVEDGRDFVRQMDPRQDVNISETVNAVSTLALSNIINQLLYTTVMEAAQSEEYVFTNLIPTVTTQFSGERIPGVAGLGDAAEIVAEGAAYPKVGVSDDYIDTPPTVKRGLIVPVTKEVIYFDRTNLVLDRASQVGLSLGLNKEKRAIDCVIDENTTAHRHKWRGNVLATYGDNSGTHNFDNLSATTGLVDFTDIDAMEQLLAAIVDPNTGEPIVIKADTLIATPQLVHTARSVINATMIRLQAGGFATSGDLYSRESPNPIGGGPFSANYNLLTSRLLAARMATDTSWFLGNPKMACVYMQNFPLTVEQAKPGSDVEFTNDIVMQFKASERGAYYVKNPRLMAKATA